MKLKWKILIAAVAAAVLIAGGFAWYYVGHNSSDPVYVYSIDMVGMTNYWGDSRETYGPVSTDRVQTVFLTETQTVTEILVSEGDEVKKGDLLMTFDTTLSDIALERKRLEVEKLKLQLEDANAELIRLGNLKPMVPPTVQPANPGSTLTTPYQIASDYAYDGSAPEKAILVWVSDSTAIEDALLEAIRSKVETIRNENAQTDYEILLEELEEGEEAPEPPTHIDVDSYYAVFKMTSGNTALGGRLTWQGLHVYRTESGFTFRFFDGSGLADYLLTDEELGDQNPSYDMGSGYTSAQIQQMRDEQKETIKGLEFQLKLLESEFTIMEKEMGDGNVYAETDGRVTACLTEEEAKETYQPILKISGGGGFLVEGSVSELEREELELGQEVNITDWESGGFYTGTVTAIRDFPSNNRYGYGAGNPNVSYYPFQVFVDESADLRAGSYVNIEYSAAAASDVVYLQSAFVRTENGSSYILVQGANGRLEQRAVVTGKTVWGNVEIRSGLNRDDQVAFPYGKNVKPGVKTVPGDYTTLYGN